MPVVRNILPCRQSRRLRQAEPKTSQDDHLWETYNDILLATQSDASLAAAAQNYDTCKQFDTLDFSPAEAVEHINRPRNAFFCFRSEYVKLQKEASSRPGSLDQTVMSRGAGDVWRSMGEAERLPYVRMAEEEKQAHTLKYPHYRYSPGSGGAVKLRKSKPVVSRRVSIASSDASGTEPRPSISDRHSSQDREPNPPAPRRGPRKKSSPRNFSPPITEKATIAAFAPVPAVDTPGEEVLAAATAQIVAENTPVVDVVVDEDCSPKAAPLSNDCDMNKAGFRIDPTHVRPSSWDRVPTQFGFKEGISSSLIDSLTLVAPTSRASSPSPIISLCCDSPTLSSEPAAQSWDAAMYNPFEMHDDTLELEFGQIAEDFGFFHPWKLEESVSSAGL